MKFAHKRRKRAILLPFFNNLIMNSIRNLTSLLQNPLLLPKSFFHLLLNIQKLKLIFFITRNISIIQITYPRNLLIFTAIYAEKLLKYPQILRIFTRIQVIIAQNILQIRLFQVLYLLKSLSIHQKPIQKTLRISQNHLQKLLSKRPYLSIHNPRKNIQLINKQIQPTIISPSQTLHQNSQHLKLFLRKL